jgi:hypothetical protein
LDLLEAMPMSPAGHRLGCASLCNHNPIEADRFSRKLNTSPSTVEDKEFLKKPLCTPMLKKIDLHFPLGLEVTARNLKGVTIKDALDAIHKQFKKKVWYTSFPSIALKGSTPHGSYYSLVMSSTTYPLTMQLTTSMCNLQSQANESSTRPMTSLKPHTSLDSSGTRRSATHGSS